MKAVVGFYNMAKDEEGLYKAIEKYLHVKRKNIDTYWRAEMAKYRQPAEPESR